MPSLLLAKKLVHPITITGSIIEARLTGVSIGELCHIGLNLQSPTIIAAAQVIGFKQQLTILNLIGSVRGLSRESVIIPTGEFQTIDVGMFLLGSVMSASGQIVEYIGTAQPEQMPKEKWMIDKKPPNYLSRKAIDTVFPTNIKVVDSLITCGRGQRVGIFAAAGSGKTTLLKMIIDFSEADIFVIGLVGERGREVTEFVESMKGSKKADNTVVVYGTSDYSALERSNAALQATTIAEYFSAQGKNVVLLIDSMTRYARALRDVSLAAGESPVRRGYPASVFERLPELLERPGNFRCGSITAFYTILLENDIETDPIAEEIRSILDGHIYLSRELAEVNHYPAIDVLRSQSRLYSIVTTPQQQQDAAKIRSILARLKELEILVNLGEYKEGQNADNDHAMLLKHRLNDYLRQDSRLPSDLKQTLGKLHELAS